MGLSPGRVEELSHRPLPPLSLYVPAQPSGSKVGESLEEHESSNDIEYHQILKDYCKIQVVLSSTKLNVEMLCSELDAARDALQASKNLAS